MGAWGVEPFEDDTTLDFIGDFLDCVEADRRVRDAFDRYRQDHESGYHYVRGACYLLALLYWVWPGTDSKELASEGAGLLREIRSDPAIVQQLWFGSDDFVAAVDRQIEALEGVLRPPGERTDG